MIDENFEMINLIDLKEFIFQSFEHFSEISVGLIEANQAHRQPSSLNDNTIRKSLYG